MNYKNILVSEIDEVQEFIEIYGENITLGELLEYLKEKENCA